MQEKVIDERDAGQRLDKYLKKYLPGAASGFLYKMLRKKNITLNGKKAEGNALLAEGDCIVTYFSEETFQKLRACPSDDVASLRAEGITEAKLDIPIVYEDEDLLFLNKPSGMPSQADESGAYSANDWLYDYCDSKGERKDTFRPTVCNRLDRNTAGLLLCAKTYAGSRFLSDLIRAHQLRKVYRALAEGEMSGEGVLRGIWRKDTKKNKVTIRKLEGGHKNLMETKGGHNNLMETGEAYVETHYRVISCADGISSLEVELVTGRSHQIRAHLASIGHPLAGDIKYGGHPYKGQKVQQLTAVRVIFPEGIVGAFSYMSGKIISLQD